MMLFDCIVMSHKLEEEKKMEENRYLIVLFMNQVESGDVGSVLPDYWRSRL